MLAKILQLNVHPIERVIRVLAGIALVSMAFGPENPRFFLGIVPILTGLTGRCPPYALLGISTCKKQ